MTEQENLQPKEVWETLSDPEKETVIYLGVPHWQSGVGGDYLEAMGADDKDVKELIKRRIVDARPGWEFAQEYLDHNKDRIDEVETRLRDPLTRLVDDDRRFLSEVSNRRSVAEQRNEALRYRLSDEELHKFVNDFAGMSE